MDLKNDIKVMGGFQKTINALYAAITVIRALAVAFLLLHAVLLLPSPDKFGFKMLK